MDRAADNGYDVRDFIPVYDPGDSQYSYWVRRINSYGTVITTSIVYDEDPHFDPTSIVEKHRYVSNQWMGHRWDQQIRLFYAV